MAAAAPDVWPHEKLGNNRGVRRRPIEVVERPPAPGTTVLGPLTTRGGRRKFLTATDCVALMLRAVEIINARTCYDPVAVRWGS